MQIKHRGAITNPEGRFEKEKRENIDDGWDISEPEILPTLETLLLQDKAKTIITRNDSPDIGFEQSINPYRGCEHGCIYCYARPSHAYMNLSPGLDFESKIFYKVDASKILEQQLAKPNYICQPIMLGANTDPYQPVEGKLKVTRSILEVLHRYKHPVAVITKSTLIERDLDLLTDMAKQRLTKVAVTITTLSNSLKQILEPRAAAPSARLRIIRNFAAAGIPVRIMAAPMIPMINDMELEAILQKASEAGAMYAGYTFIRLPFEVKDLFKEWLLKHFPERKEHVMSLIRQSRGGKEYDAAFDQRMHGQGEFANLLAMRFKLACKRFNLNVTANAELKTQLFRPPRKFSAQLDLFVD
ncbi:MAG TPA: PA0069 family radical SAM protein [Gammaproteobacteria bacterium]|nr:PA0069 family radical SAM protein [Gammaproteobacteria bacterium]